jgi:hypothetical protein
MAKCKNFLIQQGLIEPGDTFFSENPNPNAPLFITAWIMDMSEKLFVQTSWLTDQF